MVGSCRYQFSLQLVVFCWCTQKGRQIPPSWAQKQGTREEEWTHSPAAESSLHLRYDSSWNIFFKKKGGSKPSVLALISSLSVHVHSPLIELKDELSSWRRALTARGSTRPLRQIDTHELFRLTSFLRRFRAQTCTFATEIEVKNGLCLNWHFITPI